MKLKPGILSLILLISVNINSKSQVSGNCRAWLHNDTLTLENNIIYQHFKWNDGNLLRLAFGTKPAGKSVIIPDKNAVLTGDKIPMVKGSGKLTVTEQVATGARDAYLKAEVSYIAGKLSVKRVFRIVPGCPAIASEIYLKGDIASDTSDFKDLSSFVIDRVKMESYHWMAKSVEFFDMTDRTNTFVQTYSKLINRSGDHPFRGNLMLLRDGATGSGIFLLKEAPSSNAHLSYPGYDFMVKPVEVSVIGTGVKATDISDTVWTRIYDSVLGISLTNDELGLLTSLRQYQSTIRKYIPGRDNMIMMNTWGDLSLDVRVGEEFCLKELEAAAPYGITHFQIDDGWQTIRSNIAFKGVPNERTLTIKEYWEPDPVKFPQGLTNVVKKGKELGIEVCLWFIPIRNNTGNNWIENADVLIGLYRKYGIRTFKIDGVNIPDKQAEINFRKFLDKVSVATNNDVVFNNDVTTGRRGGYNYLLNEYGNIFLENRFTDWQNSFTYFPYMTLRNLWMLSKYVPPQTLQVEFLNKWRNAELYKGDPLAPVNYSFDYVFAISMMAQPLAWFEATGLPEEAKSTAGLITKYRDIQQDIQSGIILPIGDEPDGSSWTGFQSIKEKGGYLLVFREASDISSARVRTWLKPGMKIKCQPVMGTGKPVTAVVASDGSVEFSLGTRNSFVLFKYSID